MSHATEGYYERAVNSLSREDSNVRGQILRSHDISFGELANHVINRRLERSNASTIIAMMAGKEAAISWRTLTSGVAGTGAELSGAGVKGRVENALTAQTILGKLGGRVETGWSSDNAVPIEQTTFSGTWLSEEETLTAADPTTTTRRASPKRVAAAVQVSRQFLSQNGVMADNWVKSRLLAALGRAIDQAVLTGDGVKAPRGLYYNDDITTITAGAAVTSDTIEDLENVLFANNVQADSIRAVVSPKVRRKLRVKGKNSLGSDQIIELTPSSEFREHLVGWPMLTSTFQNDDTITLGDFSKIVVGLWGQGFRMVIDPFKMKQTGLVEFYAEALADVVVVHPGAFADCQDAAL